MAPKKRKQGTEQQGDEAVQAAEHPSREEVAQKIKDKLDVLDRAGMRGERARFWQGCRGPNSTFECHTLQWRSDARP